MITKKFLLIFGILTACANGKDKIKFDNELNRKEVENLLEKFNELTLKLPRYDTYFPNVYLLDTSNQSKLRLITEPIIDNNINECRSKIINVLKSEIDENSLKVIAICFLDTVEIESNSKIMKAISVYVEHSREKNGYIYYYPYEKVNDQLIFMSKYNFIKYTDKMFFN